jgi:polar amino acid transport system substrate-binding protein
VKQAKVTADRPRLVPKGIVHQHWRPAAASIVVLVCLAVAVAGCGGGGSSSSASDAASTSPQPSEASQSSSSSQTSTGSESSTASSTLRSELPKDIQSSGKITAGYVAGSPPFDFSKPGSNDDEGIDAELRSALSEVLGVTVEGVPTSIPQSLVGLETGKYNVLLTGIGDTKEREESGFSFVNYMYDKLAYVVRKDSPPVKSLTDLCGKKLGTVTGAVTFPSTMQETCEKEGKPKIEPVEFPEDSALSLALQSNRIEAYVGQLAQAAEQARQGSEINYTPAPELGELLLGIAVMKNETQLQNALLKGVEAIQANGSYQKIFKKWGVQELEEDSPGINTGSKVSLWNP